MEAVFAICLILTFVCIVIGLAILLSGEPVGVVVLILGIVCGVIAFGINDTDPQRSIDNNASHDTYGVVKEISGTSVKVDNDTFSFNQLVSSKFGTNADVKIGDVVHLTYLDGAVHDYVTKLNKVTVIEEDGGK